MKYLYQELQQFEADLSSAIEDGELQAELDEITENLYFEDILEVCQEIVYLKEVLINLGYEL
jgi:hypothetical protein